MLKPTDHVLQPFTWRGKPRGVRARTRRVLKQFAPHDFTAFHWEGTADFAHYTAVFFLLAVFLAAELNPFYLKSLLWMEPEHPFIIGRLAGVFVCALPAVRELYLYVSDPRKAVRMGQHAWLLLATIGTELLVIMKWSRGLYPEPFPLTVKWGLGLLATAIVVYPAIKVGPRDLSRRVVCLPCCSTVRRTCDAPLPTPTRAGAQAETVVAQPKCSQY